MRNGDAEGFMRRLHNFFAKGDYQVMGSLELKMDKTAKEALQQIEDKGYALPFANDQRKLFKIGINFSTKIKMIDDWIIDRIQ